MPVSIRLNGDKYFEERSGMTSRLPVYYIPAEIAAINQPVTGGRIAWSPGWRPDNLTVGPVSGRNIMARRSDTRERILDIAQDAVLAKGFDATSIEEIVVAAEITKGGFFYHFPDKNALARALIERYVVEEDQIFDDIFSQARDLSDDPLQRLLIGLRLLSRLLEDMPHGHPGCIVASAVYQDRLFAKEVREANRRAVLNWRKRFRAMLEDIKSEYPPREEVDLDTLADMVSAVVEGGIVVAKATGDPTITGRQVDMLRTCMKLLFTPPRQ